MSPDDIQKDLHIFQFHLNILKNKKVMTILLIFYLYDFIFRSMQRVKQ